MDCSSASKELALSYRLQICDGTARNVTTCATCQGQQDLLAPTQANFATQKGVNSASTVINRLCDVEVDRVAVGLTRIRAHIKN